MKFILFNIIMYGLWTLFEYFFKYFNIINGEDILQNITPYIILFIVSTLGTTLIMIKLKDYIEI